MSPFMSSMIATGRLVVLTALLASTDAPNDPEAYGNRATFHLARGDSEKALFNLDEVIRLSPGSARAYEAGDFDAAAHNRERALDLLTEKAPEKAEYRRLLEPYKAHKPHHTLGLLEEMGLKSYKPAGRSAG